MLRALGDALPHMLWSTKPDGSHDYFNARWYAFTGVPLGSVDGAAWEDVFHPDDRERARTAWHHSLNTGESYRIEYRLRHHAGDYRWTLGRAEAVYDGDGSIVRWIGTFTDVDDESRMVDQNRLLSQELGHRIKNLFAVVSGLVHQALRPHPEIAETAAALQHRIFALGRAHDYARPRDGAASPGSLRGMLRDLLAPYPAFADGRIVIGGDDISLSSEAATPVALAIHELATNAVKYGALGDESGRVELSIGMRGERAILSWAEHKSGSSAPPTTNGFGSSLIDLAIQRQLAGVVTRDWTAHGLCATIDVPIARLQAPTASLPILVSGRSSVGDI